MQCPTCGSHRLGSPTSIFIEHGEYDGKRYAEEGWADVHRCFECGFQFADLDAYDLEERFDVDEEKALRAVEDAIEAVQAELP